MLFRSLACAKRILATVARRAYRRPLTDRDTDDLLRFYRAGRARGTRDSGIEDAIAFMLASPKFLFRAEPDPPALAAGATYTVPDIELASRLSFFLWSTVPDDELVAVAASGKLHEAATLERQVRRMLADGKAKALVDNFAAQWLYLRNLQSFVPDSDEFPNFDDNLRQAMRTETSLFVESIMREDRSVLDLLRADYTFVNERLAKHYGIPNVYGSQFRRVTIADENRRGLLGQGSILALTSVADRTSPVLRGKWIMEVLLASPPPAPPPNVPTLDEKDIGTTKALTMREMMAKHRANPTCAACHAVMDPLGFALENFDATGRWRERDRFAGVGIDASGQLPDGTAVGSPDDLRNALLRRPAQFAQTFTEGLMTYATGRKLEAWDMPAVRRIVRGSAAGDYRLSAIVAGVVRSDEFRMRRVPASGADKVAAAGH